MNAQTKTKPKGQAKPKADQQEKGKQLSPHGLFRQEFETMEREIKAALPGHIKVEYFKRNVLTAVQEVPQLLNCDNRSLWHAIMTSAQLGLVVGAALGQAYILPFNVKGRGLMAQFIAGYKGYIQLARNSGEVKDLYAHVVYEGDEFDYRLGLNRDLVHQPCLDPKNRGKIVRAYAIANHRDGGVTMEVMDIDELEKVRAASKAPDSPAWKKWTEEMYRKTVLRRIAKYMPMSVQKLAVIDAAAEIEGRPAYLAEKGEVIIDGEAHEVKSGTGEKGERSEPEPASPRSLDEFEREAETPAEGEGLEDQAPPEKKAKPKKEKPEKEKGADSAPKQEPRSEEQQEPEPEGTEKQDEQRDPKEVAGQIKSDFKEQDTAEDLENAAKIWEQELGELPEDLRKECREVYAAHMQALKSRPSQEEKQKAKAGGLLD